MLFSSLKSARSNINTGFNNKKTTEKKEKLIRNEQNYGI